MGTFAKIKKYTKPLVEIENKLSRLDEAMRTTGLYSITGFEPGDPAIPEIPAVPAVPPTYENVTGGISNTDDFVWNDQGSDPNATPNISSNLYTTYNGEQVAALRTPEVNHGEGVTPLAFVYHGRALASTVLGFLSSNGFTTVAQAGVYTTPGPYTDLQSAYIEAWYNFGKSGTYQYYTTKTIYLWRGLDYLFGYAYPASQYSPDGLTNETTPKADYGLYAYTLVIPTDASGNLLPNRFVTDPGSPEIPAVPGIPEGPRRPILVRQDNLGDPNYYPGPVQVAGLTPLQTEALIDIVRKSPPGSTRTNAIDQLYKGLPGARNQQLLNNFLKTI